MHTRKTYLKVYLNSTVFFLLAYFFVSIFSQLVTIIMALAFEYKVTWKYYGPLINVGDLGWTSDSVQSIYSAAPVFQLICGFAFLAVYARIRELSGILKQFFLWGFIISFHALFINLLIGGLFNTGFGHVLRWAYIGNTGRLIHVLVGLGGVFATGYFSGRSVLISANSYFNQVKGIQKLNFYLYQVLFPFLTGLLFIYLVKIPHNNYNNYLELISIASFLFICLFLLLRFIHLDSQLFDEEKKKPYFFTPALVVLLIIVLIYRLGLAFNLQIG